jgi:hypothetical protein
VSSSKTDAAAKPLPLPLRTPRAPGGTAGSVARLWAEFTDPGPAGDAIVFMKNHADGLGPGCFGIPFMAVGVLVLVLSSRQVDLAQKKTLLPLLFGAIFGLAGLFVTTFGIRQVLAKTAGPVRRDDNPWTSDNDWDPSGAKPDDPTSAFTKFISRLVLFAFAVPLNLLWTVPIQGGGKVVVAVVVGLFDLIALGVLFELVRNFVQAARVGSTRLVWRKLPVFTGDRFEAVFQTSRTMRPNGPPEVTLRRIEQRMDILPRTGVNAGLHAYEAWSSRKQFPEFAREAMTSFPFSIDVPASQPGTDLSKNECTYWQVAVSVPVAGPDVEAVFLVPIYDRAPGR